MFESLSPGTPLTTARQKSVVREENRVKNGIEVIDLTLAKNQSNKRSTAIEIDLINLTKDDKYSYHFYLAYLLEV